MMELTREAIIAAIVIDVILTIVTILFFGGYISGSTFFGTNSTSTCFFPNATVVIATIPKLQQGAYFTSFDKIGSGCQQVIQLQDVKVIGKVQELDGDIHVVIAGRYFNNSAGIYQIYKLVTEYIPAWEMPAGFQNQTIPDVNQTINIRGIAYCDLFHQREAWHYKTCWELHPVIAWTGNQIPLPYGNFTYIIEPSGAGT